MKAYIRISVLFFFILSFLYGATTSYAASGGDHERDKVTLNGFVIDMKNPAPGTEEPESETEMPLKWIVRFTGPVTEKEKRTLEELGCEIGDYVPEFAFIVGMNSGTKKRGPDRGHRRHGSRL